VTRRQLRLLFRRGRTSLVIGLVFLAASIVSGNIAADMLERTNFADIARESLLIGGWVAMWRPLEVFLYDWWPIRADGRLLQRLATIPVRLEYAETASTDDWRSDWPAVPVGERSRAK